jgi:hypothetical protein
MARKLNKLDVFTPATLDYYATHPVEFIEDMILEPHEERKGERQYLSGQQKMVLNDLAWHGKLSVVSGRGIGKSALLALAGIWFVTVFDQAQVVLTAPSSKTLRSGLFKEYKLWLVGSYVQDLFEITAEKIYLKDEAMLPQESVPSFVEMRTASKDSPESMSGIHMKSLLVQVDEASKVADDIIRTLVATLTGGWNNKIIMTSNGTRNSGRFYDSHMNDRANLWKKYRFSSEDSPFASKESVLESEQMFGRDHDIFRVDVLGLFAKEDPDSFISHERVVAAFDRDIVPARTDEIEIGCDVARFGDDKTVLIWRQGMKVHKPVYRGKTSVVEVTEMVYQLVSQIRATLGYKETIRVKVDDTGVGGGVTDILDLDRDHNIEVVGCNFGGKGDEKYGNEASIMWGCLRDNIDRISLPDEEECENIMVAKHLREELSARRVDYGTGKIKIEPKGNFKKEFGRSPDYADALVLCFARKKNVRSFLADFDHLSDQFVVDGMNYMNGLEHYVSVHYTANRQASIVWAYWGNGILYIVNESMSDDNVARVASEIQARSNVQPVKILGNDRCFGSPSQDIRAQLRKYRVRLRENFKYDELGALELLNQLVATKSIKLVGSCQATIHQLDRWNSDAKRAQAEQDFGLCYAILNVVSELKSKINPVVRKREERTPYKDNSTNANLPQYNKALAW